MEQSTQKNIAALKAESYMHLNPHGYRWSAEFPVGRCYFRTRELMRVAVRERNEDWRPNGGYVIDANQRLY